MHLQLDKERFLTSILPRAATRLLSGFCYLAMSFEVRTNQML